MVLGTPPSYLLLKPGPHRLLFTAAGRQPEERPVFITAGGREFIPILLAAAPAASETPFNLPRRNSAARAVEPDSLAPPVQPPAQTVQPKGKLAVSSAVPVEIAINNQVVGITPATIELAPGTYSVEYRYRDLRQTATYVIKSNETTSATVTFTTTVQINAKPWAEVFIVKGDETVSLGETPLSGVSVPLGSVLRFKNPQFPDKVYRVNGNTTAIQVVFP
jgi:hypothetical protein